MKRHLLFTPKRQSETPGVAEFLKGPSTSVPNINSDQLRAFVVLAEELNFTQAADRLHHTQATLNKQITDLEVEFRCRLFTRDKAGVRLTNAARVVVKEVRSALLDMERAFERARAAQERSNSVLTIERSPDAHQALQMDSQRHIRLPRKGEEQ
jgi:DNA-binding transcriptional LysR family regulator